MKFKVWPSTSSNDCSFWSTSNNIRFQVQYLKYAYKYFIILLHNYVFTTVYKTCESSPISQGNKSMDTLTGNVVLDIYCHND